MNIKTLRFALWGAVVLAALALVTVPVLLRPAQQTGLGHGHYSLIDQNGRSVDQNIFLGHPSALFFGYTHCPDVCPTTMAEMASWFAELGDDGKDLRAYFVSIDPQRDTPAVLGDYVSWVSDRITGLTGTPEEIAKIAKAWGIYYAKVPLAGEDYSMDHTASVFLLDAKGDFDGTIAYGEDQATAVAKLRNLLGKS